jgi:hypothetical protein
MLRDFDGKHLIIQNQCFHNMVSVFFFAAHMIKVIFRHHMEIVPQRLDILILTKIIMMPGG